MEESLGLSESAVEHWEKILLFFQEWLCEMQTNQYAAYKLFLWSKILLERNRSQKTLHLNYV